MRAHRKPELPGGDIWGTRWGSNWSNTSEAVEEALGTKSLRMLMGWEGVFPKVFQETRPIWGGGGVGSQPRQSICLIFTVRFTVAQLRGQRV